MERVLAAGLKVVGHVALEDGPGRLVGRVNSDGSVVLRDRKTGADVKSNVTDENPLRSECNIVRARVQINFRLNSTESKEEDCFGRFVAQLKAGDVTFLLKDTIGKIGFKVVDPLHPLDVQGTWDSPVELKPMHRTHHASSPVAPSLDVQLNTSTVLWSTYCLDVVCFVPKQTLGKSLITSYVVPAMIGQAERMVELSRQTPTKSSNYFKAFHFWPTGHLEFPLVVEYPMNNDGISLEPELSDLRRSIHVALGLPLHRPLLRPTSAVGFQDAPSTRPADGQSRLMDVHRDLPKSPVKNGKIHMIQGHYMYYHYMQDKYDDSGWGCAYRSLQTIASWFALQGYSSRDPPSHKEIQTTLVSIGDKSRDFIGSKNWIGAIELGYVLDSLYNVQSKIITVSDGSNMPSVAREIGQHFDTQGTPIMIGGGVLAYTLLGIDYNENTGDCAFLILDPHYTGADVLTKIHQGNWVAWKQVGDKAAAGGDLFVSGAFYNLLCPQCPAEV